MNDNSEHRSENISPAQSKLWAAPYLIAAAVLHVVSTVAVFLAGKYAVAPSVASPAGLYPGDAERYLEQALSLANHLGQLAAGDEQIHVRFYAISCALLAPIFGPNVLSIQLISLPLYLAMLVLTYKVGAACFGERAGLLAAIITAGLPSLLFHATQPLRDPLFIVLMLVFVWLLISILTQRLAVRQTLLLSAAGSLTLSLLWLVRDNFLLIYAAMVGLALVALAAIFLRRRTVWLTNAACLLVLLATVGLAPKVLSSWLPTKSAARKVDPNAVQQVRQLIEVTPSDSIGKLNLMRQKFAILYYDAGSNIDVYQTFETPADVVAYLPRALEIGLLAPFPVHWVRPGAKHGLAGRAVAGVEMLFTYLLLPFAGLAVWRSRKSLSSWYLLSVLLVGATALGLVVTNLGALFRLRYFFWIVLIILASASLAPILARLRIFGFIRALRKQSA